MPVIANCGNRCCGHTVVLPGDASQVDIQVNVSRWGPQLGESCQGGVWADAQDLPLCGKQQQQKLSITDVHLKLRFHISLLLYIYIW